ncbi:metal ABC transporter substrate-binding protein [Ferribacterium limneticum]|uniref:metal ABC transporter substrate-binding protein n=1 Tax=Ferribacterium limneticum TaxID=76259 RepID=UPI001CF95BDA|nr:zinc ABC transporter substrate-binding protein [Ferribacterium limneticum]UCV28734.1 zinc ABC transporter substrate-binding protein [Ferribacterium limneticum]UCV32651.1 zinc ABC transporter substrate-binding protein [Ferribacterium limneticum]
MKHFAMSILLAVTGLSAQADLKVFATVPEWGALAKEIGGDKVRVYTATNAFQDPHRIEAKPSLLAQARQANLLVAAGADLEIGWLPLVLRDSGNSAIQNGRSGYFEASAFVNRLDVPATLDRAHGDLHAAGNPHTHLDPRNVLKVGEALTARMAELDAANATSYQAAFKTFASKWQVAIARWEKEAAPLKGVPVLVHHQSFVYLSHWLGLKEVGALEPKPGIEPTSGHLTGLLSRQQTAPARMVLRAAYQQEGPSQWIAGKTGIPAVLLPYTVGGTPEAGDLFGLYDDTIQRLLKGIR